MWSGQGGTFSPTQQTYLNERNTSWEYDDEGNLTHSGVAYTIDAAGQTSRTVSVTSFPPDGEPVGIYGSRMDMTQGFDGDGLVVKKLGVETLLDSDPEGNVRPRFLRTEIRFEYVSLHPVFRKIQGIRNTNCRSSPNDN